MLVTIKRFVVLILKLFYLIHIVKKRTAQRRPFRFIHYLFVIMRLGDKIKIDLIFGVERVL